MNSFYKQLIFIVLGVAIIATGVLVAVAVNNRGVSPVLHLRLDEGYGASAYDASGNTNMGTITNVAWKNEPECKTGKCLFFDGVGDYITISDSSELSPIRGVTVQTWVRPNNFDSTASLILKDTQYSLDIAQGVPNFRAYVNGLWQSAIGTARAWLFRESFDNQLTGDTATFTEAFGYRALGPSSLTSENGILITDADGTGSGTGDDLQYTRGSQSTPDGTSYTFENFNPNQGTLEFWVRPNWDGGDGLGHYIFENTDGTNFVALYKPANNSISFFLRDKDGGNHYVSYSVSAWSAGDWHHVVATWDFKNDSQILYFDGSLVDDTGHGLSSDSIDGLSSTFALGQKLDNSEQFNGTISGRILNRPLTSSEVTALYNSGAGHTDTFTVTPDTVWMGTYSDSTTTAAYWHTGKSVSAIADGGTEDTITTASGADNSFSNDDRIVVYDGTGYKIEGCVDGTPTDTTVLIDNCSNGDAGLTENVGVFTTLNGSTEYFSGGDVLNAGTNDISISAWVKMDGNPSVNEVIAQKYGSGVGHSIYINTSGALTGYIQDSGGTVISSDGDSITDNKWHHVAVVYDRSGNMTRYLDGYAYSTTDDISARTSTITNSANFVVGANSANNLHFGGSIRDVRIYIAAGTVWSDANILGQATNPLTPGSNGTNTSYWEFTDASAAANADGDGMITDGSGSGYHLDAIGGDTTDYSTHSRAQAAFVSKNLIVDPGMENGGIGAWRALSGLNGYPNVFEKSTSIIKFDQQSLKTSNNLNTPRGFGQDISFIGTEQNYCFGAWIKDLQSNLRMDFIGNGTYFGTGTGWNFYEICAKSPSSYGSYDRFVGFANYDATDKISYIDQMYVLPNLVDNGGLEGGADPPAGWSVNGGTVTSDTDEHSGTYSAKTVAGSGQGPYQAVSVTDGKWYTVSFWAKISSGTLNTAGFYQISNDQRVSITAAANGNTWTKYSQTFKATNGGSQQITFYASGSSTYYVDDVSLILLDTAPASTVTPSTQANSFGTGKWSDTNGAFLVDGLDELTYPTAGNVSASTGTIAVWVKPNGWDGDDGLKRNFVIIGEDDTENLYLYKFNDDTLRAGHRGNSVTNTVTYAVNSSNFASNTWYHVAMTYGTGDYLRLYLDGVEVGTAISGIASLTSMPSDINIGSYTTGINQADAYFDDVRIYDEILSASEILALYNDTNPTTISANQWSHVTGVYSRDDNDIKTYVNGVLKTTYNVGSNYKLGTSTNSITIGDEFTGYLDDIKIYDEPRTASQIRSDYVSSMTARGASGRSVTIGEGIDASEGLVAHWAMDETSANTCSGGTNDSCDSSGNGNDGAWNGNATATSTAKYGYAVTFDGTGDYVDLTGITVNSPHTISMWAKFSVFGSNSYLFDSESGRVIFGTNGGGSVLGYHDGSSWNDSTAVIADGNWHHIVVVTGSSPGKATLYVDGVSVLNPSVATNNLSGTIVLGSRYSGDSDFVDGQIDDVKIYNVARSASQIRKDYETGPPPVAHWKFDEGGFNTCGTAQDACDSSGNGNHLTAIGDANFANGKYGGGAIFDGVGDWYCSDTNDDGTCDDDDDLDFGTGDFTIEFWHKTSNTNNDFPIWKGGYYNGPGYYFYKANDGRMSFGVSDGTAQRIQVGSSTVVEDNVWRHIAGVSGNGKLRYYENGILMEEVTDYVTSTVSTTTPFSIGNFNPIIAQYTGQIDDVRIYNYARTQKQIMQDMNAGHPAVGSPVGSYVGYWKFDEGYASTSYDMSISQNNGTLTGGVTWTQSGKFGSALDFDGENDYVSVADDVSLDITGGLTASMWVKPDGNQGLYTAPLMKGSDRWGFSIRDATTQISFLIHDGAVEFLTPVSTLTASVWSHILGVHDGNAVYLYVNGELVGSTATNGNAIDTDNDFLRIGSDKGFADRYWDGLIDDVRIYNYALTPTQIRNVYNQNSAVRFGPSSGLP